VTISEHQTKILDLTLKSLLVVSIKRRLWCNIQVCPEHPLISYIGKRLSRMKVLLKEISERVIFPSPVSVFLNSLHCSTYTTETANENNRKKGDTLGVLVLKSNARQLVLSLDRNLHTTNASFK
jgi:hypothetical protein